MLQSFLVAMMVAKRASLRNTEARTGGSTKDVLEKQRKVLKNIAQKQKQIKNKIFFLLTFAAICNIRFYPKPPS